ncbi:hypothetical protein [Lysobacter sp. CA199]|uniref:hypothetical protein n=1 Tax=Lysobacter sp. CA199 TaxID=3455608 RepID=UPI003F8CFE3C
MNTCAFPRARRLSLACALLAASIAPAFAQAPSDGALDPSFGRGGTIRNDVPKPLYGQAFAIQNDGKIVVLATGYYRWTPIPVLKCHLSRLQADGQPDLSFGNNGGVDIAVQTSEDKGSCDTLTLQPDGKILVAGLLDDESLLLRYNPDGTPDRSFSGDGIATTDGDWDSDYYGVSNYDVAVQADGKIVVALNVIDYWSAFNWGLLVRYHSNGELDRSFGDSGVALSRYEWSENGVEAREIAIQPDGKIVVAGTGAWVWWRGGTESVMARYLTDGRPDPTFGSNGVSIRILDAVTSGATSLAIQADGKLVTGHGVSRDPAPPHGTLVRYNPDGSLDTSYVRPDLDIPVHRVAQQADGRILTANIFFRGFSVADWMRRVNPDGTIDTDFVAPSFNFDGVNGYFQDIALQTDGKPVVLAILDGDGHFGMARLSNATYCIADPYNPGRFVGFSDSGWFTTANSGVGGTGFVLSGRGSIQAWNRPGVGQMHRLTASAASPTAVSRVDASVFTNGSKGWGFGNVFANGSTPARYAVLDTSINEPGCVVRPGR